MHFGKLPVGLADWPDEIFFCYRTAHNQKSVMYKNHMCVNVLKRTRDFIINKMQNRFYFRFTQGDLISPYPLYTVRFSLHNA